MAGYSGTPLPQKLGIKENHRLLLLSAPENFSKTLGKLPAGVTVREKSAGRESFQVIVRFVTSRRDLEKTFATTSARLDPSGGFWVAWPKRASGVETDVTEDVVREIALGAGLVDNKVCAIDETWSGLRLVVRVADRPKKKATPAKFSR